MSIDNIESKTAKQWGVHALLVLAVMLIATSFPLGKLIAEELPTDIMMQIRFMMAAILFAPIVFVKHGFSLPSAKKQIQYALLSLPLITFFLCMFEALKTTSAMNTGALFTMVPAITAVFNFLLNGEKSSSNRILGLLIGTTGALWIVFSGNINALLSLDLNQGDIIFLFGVVAFSLYNSGVKRIYTNEPTEVMTFWVILYGALWLSVLSAPQFAYISWQSISNQVYFSLFYLALFTTLVTFYLFQLGTVKIGPTKVAAYGFLNPIFVLGFSILLGIATFSATILPGLILVGIAMLLILRESQYPRNIDSKKARKTSVIRLA